jgi:transposase-like protein
MWSRWPVRVGPRCRRSRRIPGISESCLHRWLKLADVDDGVRPGVTSRESAELREVKKRNLSRPKIGFGR